MKQMEDLVSIEVSSEKVLELCKIIGDLKENAKINNKVNDNFWMSIEKLINSIEKSNINKLISIDQYLELFASICLLFQVCSIENANNQIQIAK